MPDTPSPGQAVPPFRPVIVRDAADADMPAIHALYAHHVLHGLASFEEVPPSLDALCQRRDAALRAGLPYLAGEMDGILLGFATAGPYRPRPAYRHTIENTVYVAQGAGRHGIGSALLAALIDRCSAGSWRQMVAVIGDSANLASIALHRAHGFREVGTLAAVGFKFGRWVDSVLMQRPLGDGDATPPPATDRGGHR
ncbi:MAG: N-acetyltransferase [Rhodospirillaceae bacterium]|nr:N-acetyltransferase [Rhodospirillaceae bacterium]